ncbi:MAG: response regulator [Lachnospiraceae bacterium]|nr:response regulator [Lachnospiraceae bacterium]
MRILAVEDEKLALDGLCETLRRVLPKSEVHACTTMEEALAAGRQNAFQIAFLDIELGMGSGIAPAEKL